MQGPPANTTVENSYLKFDLSTLPSGAVGSDVAKATLTIGVSKVTKAGSFDVFRVTSAWTESGITDAAVPTLGSSPEVSGVAVAVSDKNTSVMLPSKATLPVRTTSPSGRELALY